MGLLSFLQRKSGDKKKVQPPSQAASRAGSIHSPLKSHAYHSAPAGALPVIGAYPVAGNGPNILESLSKTRGRLNEEHVLSDAASAADSSAPSPAIPRLRGEEEHERPRTAPQGCQGMTNWMSGSNRLRKNSLRGAPPVSILNPRKDILKGSHALQDIGPGLLAEPPVVPASFPYSHSRSDSMRSNTDSVFKDILDAQSEIKPHDFRSRLKAAGARDYGEDVADRNIGQNGVNLQSPQVQAYYATAQSSSVKDNDHHSSPARTLRQDVTSAPSTYKQNSSKPLSHPHKALNSARQFSFPKKTTAQAPQSLGFPAFDDTAIIDVKMPMSRSTHRQSLHTYVPTGSEGGDGRTRSRPTSSHRGIYTRDLPHHTKMSEMDMVGRTSSLPDAGLQSPVSPGFDSYVTSRHNASNIASNSKRASLNSNSDPRRPRISSIDYGAEDGHLDRYRPSDRPFSPQKELSPSHRGSVPRFASRRQSGHTFQSSISSSTASHDTAAEFTPLAYPSTRPRTAWEEQRHPVRGLVRADATDLGVPAGSIADTSPSHYTETSLTGEVGQLPYGRQRSRSMTSTIGKGRHDEMAEHIPGRTSSIRHWSLSSTSTSTASSPSLTQSRHTPATSLDLGNTFSLKSSSRTSLNTTIATSPRTAKSGRLNIDDYVSSDDDDFTTPRPRGECEEELLLKEAGYGRDGALLPGLFNGPSFPSYRSSRPRSVSSLPSGVLHKAYNRPLASDRTLTMPSPRQKRYVLNTAADSDSDAGDSEPESWYDAREQRCSQEVSPLRGARGTKRLSALGAIYGQSRYVDDVIEEERLEKIDVAAAIKLRKEAKARKRNSQMAQRRSQIKGKQPMTMPPAEADEVNNADVE